jgi:hypothetical protein
MTVAVFGSLWCGWRTHRDVNHARTIEDHPTSTIRGAHQGYVELEGIAKFVDKKIEAPYSHLPCVWYRYKVEQEYTTGNRRDWRTVDKGTSSNTFLLNDGTGTVVIDPEDAIVTPRVKHVWTAHGQSLLGSTESRAFAARLGVTEMMRGNRYRYTEERLLPGKSLYVLGLMRNFNLLVEGPSLKEQVADRLREWKANQPVLHERFDLDKNGRLDEREWMLVRSAARREVEAERREEQKRYTEGINILGRPDDTRRPFLISAYNQKEIIRRYRLYSALMAIGFFSLGVAALWIFNLRFLPLLG